MRNHPAFTLIELILTIGLTALVSSFGFTSFIGIRNRQSLAASADEIKSVTDRAHIYAREGKEEKSWGIKKKDDDEYYLINGKKSSYAIIREYRLQQPTVFKEGNFEIWFDIGTGETNAEKSIILKSPKGDNAEIHVSKSGLTEIKSS